MTYRVIGLMSGSSLDGLDVAFIEFTEQVGKWTYDIIEAETLSYDKEWEEKLRYATNLSSKDYLVLHSEYGHFLGKEINKFIEKNKLHYKVSLICSHGHTTFHEPLNGLTAQLGNGASIAAETGLPVVTDLRALDVAFKGQGAPIVPIGEKLLFPSNKIFLNIGGIANISLNLSDKYIAFDICAANSILNELSRQLNLKYDEGGMIASTGKVNYHLLDELNNVEFYKKSSPKSLSNQFASEFIFPVIQSYNCLVQDALKTYCEHISIQIYKSILPYAEELKHQSMLITGGGAHNSFLTKCINDKLSQLYIGVSIPDNNIINFKEAVIMGLFGILRWRNEYNILCDVTGAQRNSIGGAVWTGEEA